jgi:hypothetical protein
MSIYTEGLKKLSDGRYRLIEKLTLDKNSIVKKVKLQEKKLTETINNQELPIYGTYLIKVWAKSSFNKNQRNYSNVFNKVLKENKTTIGFCGHPEDGEEDYKNVCLIAKNPILVTDDDGEEWLAVEITLIGKPYGENFEAVLESGGFLEFSSAADGEVDDNGYVELDGFELLRWADIVVYSSNGQLFFKDKGNIEDIPLSSKPDNVIYDKDDEEIQEQANSKSLNDLTENHLTIYKEEKEINRMETKLLEKVLEANIRALIKDADKTDSLEEKKNILTNALENSIELSDKTLKESITSKLAETEKAILDLAEKGKKVGALEESVTTLSTEKDTLSKDIETLKKEKEDLETKYKTLTEMYESKQYASALEEIEDVKELKKINKELTKSNLSLKKEINKKEAEKKVLQSRSNLIERKASIKEALANTKVDVEIVTSLKEDNELLTQEVLDLKDTVRRLRGRKMEEKKEKVQFNNPSRFQKLLKKKLEKKNSEEKNLQEKDEEKKDAFDIDVNKILSERGLE